MTLQLWKPRRRSPRWVFLTAAALPVILAVSLMGWTPEARAAIATDSGAPPHEPAATRTTNHAPIPRGENRAEKASLKAGSRPAWPTPSAVEVDLSAAAAQRSTAAVKADGLPVRIGPARGTAGGGADRQATPTPAKVRLEMLGHDKAVAAGFDGVLFRMSRVDSAASVAAVSTEVDYSSFRDAYGGDWAGRLRLMVVPDCALTTPGRAECLGTVLPSTNDTAQHTVRSDITVSEAGVMVALASGESGEGGDYAASSLSPSATWKSGGSTGDFSWSYQMTMPPALGGPLPQVGFAYSSGTVDGRVSSANTQPSWLGEGFDYWPGYVERKYKDCQADGWSAYDNCWFSDNATISLNGRASELVKDDTTGVWRFKNDDGSKVERLTGADNGDLNVDGSTEGEFWKVTTTDGTQYFFGLHKLSALPASAGVTGMPGAPNSNSAWTAPVIGNNTGEPCFRTKPADSMCQQAWRWNLDYVVDTHGNTMAYFYGAESNKYRSMTMGVDKAYVRGGWLDRIEYGMRAGQTWTATAATAQVKFDAVERCVPGSPCAKPGDYPDVPWDQECVSACTKLAPTFWTSKRLGKVTTRVLRGSAYDDVDSWTLTHGFPSTGDNIGTPVLWLQKIVHTGHLGSTDAAMPAVVFDGAPTDNRITSSTNNPVRKWRMTHIDNETGGSTVITYAPTECSLSNLPASPQANTMRCMPVWWTPPGGTEGLYWFHKYVVAQVDEQDRNAIGLGLNTTTAYKYVGNAAWHYDEDNGLVAPEKKTWGQWRGYGLVETRTGNATDGKTLEVTRYYRGMDGDRDNPSNPASKRPASDTNITDGLGGVVADLPELAGQPREVISYSADGGTVLTRSISDGWVSTPTATETHTWATVKAAFTQVASTRVQSKTYNSTRVNKITKSFNSLGMVTKLSDLGDETVSGDEECTRITYAPGTTFAIRTEKYALDCSAVPDLNPDGTLTAEVASEQDIISDQRTLYDGATTWSSTMAVAKGDVTSVEEIKKWTPSGREYIQVTKIEPDAYGRGVKQWDSAGKLTQTVYTPATGGPVTEVKTINPLGHETRTLFEVGNGAPLKQIDANGRTTELEYDGLGRLVRSWLPGRTKGVDQPNSFIDYKIRQADGTNAVTTRSIRSDGSYNVSIELFDGLMRSVQTQVAAPGGGRTVSSTFYNSRGQVVKQHSGFWDPAAPADTYQSFDDATIPAMVKTVYDGSGRVTDQIYLKKGVEQWRSKAVFEGDRITSIPPSGGTPTQVTFDSLGRATELKEFTSGSVTGAFTRTQYKFNRRSQQTEIWDSANNKWTYKYDVRGRLIESTDPDKGKSRVSYNDANDVVYSEGNIDPQTDVGQKTYYEYDDLGRVIRTRKDSETGTILTEATFDTLVKGAPTSSTRYVDGNPYTVSVQGYDTAYRPTGTTVTLPPSEGLLAGSYTFSTTYNPDGSPATSTSPQIGDLPQETFTYGYTAEGLPLSMSSELGTYVNTAFYTSYGEVSKLVLGTYPKRVNLNYTYEEGSRRTESIFVTRDGGLGNSHKEAYTYNAIGDLTQLVTTGGGTTDTQCFNYDEKRRLKQAYTPSSNDCASQPTSGTLGGPAPYWHTWKYDTSGQNNEITVGNRTEQIKHAITTGGTDVKTEYVYPSAGGDKPHSLSQIKVTDAAGTRAYDYKYDNAGNTTQRPTASGALQQLTWNSDGTLAKVVEGTKTTSYIYDPAGNRLLQKDGSTVTAWIGDTEVKLSGTVKTATRYYDFAGQTVAARTATGLKWLCSNSQQTAVVSIDAANTATIDRRRYTPFGELRTTPNWTGSQGFVGGTNDATGLVHLGAREYDSLTGRFISVDPIIDQGDPQQMHGYAYANNNPTSFSDPSGLMLKEDGDAGGTGGDTTDETGEGEITLPPDIQAMLDEAKRIQKMSILDIILEAGGEILKELLGINDILDCFQKGDIVACISIVANIIPWGKIFKLPKLVKAIERAWSAVNAFWEKLKWAKRIFAQVEEYYQLARKAAREAAERLAAARRAKAEAEAAAKAAKAKAEAEARRAAKEAAEARAKREAKEAAKEGAESCKHSFAAGTLVLLADGTVKPIEQLTTGDKVVATDPESGKTTEETVSTRHINQDKDLTDVTVVDEDGQTSTISTTWHHPFWDDTAKKWVDAADLKVGHSLRVADRPAGAAMRVASVVSFVGDRQMFDLTVDVVHTYYVVVDSAPVLVHNCDSAKLGRNLTRNGEAKPANIDAQAHHIVPCGSKLAAPAQRLLKKHGIDINSAENGVWMSQKGHSATFRHTYYAWLNAEIRAADRAGGKQGVLDFLAATKQELSQVDDFIWG
ncbi:polymorphic toxin-type HINT domain-containing protein [Hamadaea sp. NPDC050747]|uniref:polymorphic toxin-type HINT domain-containing protein n=1 Tax=Hamadaea sp. NPDC050747 TaxID=3155789 RepID=UPI0033E1BB5F